MIYTKYYKFCTKYYLLLIDEIYKLKNHGLNPILISFPKNKLLECELTENNDFKFGNIDLICNDLQDTIIINYKNYSGIIGNINIKI